MLVLVPFAAASPALWLAPEEPDTGICAPQLLLLQEDPRITGAPLLADEGRAVVEAALGPLQELLDHALMPERQWSTGFDALIAQGRTRPDGPVCALAPTRALLRKERFPEARATTLTARCEAETCWLFLWLSTKPMGGMAFPNGGSVYRRPVKLCPDRPEGTYFVAQVEHGDELSSWLEAAGQLEDAAPPCYWRPVRSHLPEHVDSWTSWPPQPLSDTAITQYWSELETLWPSDTETVELVLALDASGAVERCEGDVPLCQGLDGVGLAQESGRAVLVLRNAEARRKEITHVQTESAWLRPHVSYGSRAGADLTDCALETGFSGSTSLSLQLAPSGHVVHTWVEDRSPFAACVRERAARWAFPCLPPSEEDLFELTLSFR
jgi:hypothetical protein